MILVGSDGTKVAVRPSAAEVLDITPPPGVGLLTPVRGARGPRGPQGTGVNLKGAVPTYADLPDDLTIDNAGAAYVVQDNGLLYVWSGTVWPAEENGSLFQGDTGPTGRGIADIALSAGDLDFLMSDGTHEIVDVPDLDAAAASASAAAGSASAAAGSATAADSARITAQSARDTAVAKAGESALSAAAASGSASAADADRVDAQAAAATATTQAGLAAERADDAMDSRNDAVAAKTAAETARDDAAGSATAADSSASTATGAAATASGARDAAIAARDIAQAAATAADGSADAAVASAVDADADRQAAQTAAATATTKAALASDAADDTDADRIATQAARSAAEAAQTAAGVSATAADGSAAAAASSETNAANSADAASDSAAAAAASAEEAADTVATGVPNATAVLKGGIVLPGGAPGELGGTWDHPTVTGWAGKADLDSNGKLLSSQIPAQAQVKPTLVANTAQRLALTDVQEGDVAIQTGNPGRGTYMLGSGSPSVEGSWILQVSPTDAVSSVNGYQGIVVLGKGDVGLPLVDNTPDSAKPVSTPQQDALNGKANAAHNHSAADINTGTFAIGRIPTGNTAATVALGNDSRLANDRTPIDGSVSTAKIADDAVTIAKVSPAIETSLGKADTAVQPAAMTAAIDAKIQVVSSLPGSPTTGVLYLVPE